MIRTAILRSPRSFSAIGQNLAAPKLALPHLGSMINNQWYMSGNDIQTLNPATEEVIATVKAAGKSEVRHVLMSAETSLSTWPLTSN